MQIILEDKYCLKIRYKKNVLLVGQDIKKTILAKADIAVCPGINLGQTGQFGQNKTFLINSPGEYEISGVFIYGTKDFYTIELGDVKICFLSNLETQLKESQLEELDGTDILFLLLGNDFIEVEKAIKLVNQIQPSLLLPVDQEEISHFLQKLGYENPKTEKKLKITKQDLPEEMEVILLELKNG